MDRVANLTDTLRVASRCCPDNKSDTDKMTARQVVELVAVQAANDSGDPNMVALQRAMDPDQAINVAHRADQADNLDLTKQGARKLATSNRKDDLRAKWHMMTIAEANVAGTQRPANRKVAAATRTRLADRRYTADRVPVTKELDKAARLMVPAAMKAKNGRLKPPMVVASHRDINRGRGNRTQRRANEQRTEAQVGATIGTQIMVRTLR